MREIVVIHGLRDREDAYARLVEELGRFGSVSAPRAPGHDGPLGHPLRMIEWLEDVEDDLARRDMPVVVGISAGGHVAMAAAARNPGLVSGLVALDTPMALPRDRLLADDIQAVIRPDADDPEWADVVHYLTRGDLDTFFEGFPEQAPDPAITCPILLVGGDQSEGSLLTPDDLRDAEQVLPDVSSITIDNVGHTLGIDTDARILIDAIEPFLTQLATK